MAYVTGFAAAVPTEAKDAYIAHCRETAPIFRAHGATRVLECWGTNVPPGKVTSFPQAVKCEPHETVVTGIVVWPSKAVHDAGMPKVGEAMMAGFKDGTLREPPFDGMRMIIGEFEVLLDA